MKNFFNKIVLGALISFGFLSFANAKIACPNLYTNLYYGKRSEEVRQLQKFLFSYYNADGYNQTSYFGISTKNFLIKFQKDNGVRSTGVLGPLTKNKIKEVCDDSALMVCTREYIPVCGSPKFACPACVNGICPSCAKPVDMTYSNKCEMNRAGATFVHDGTCEGGTVTNEIPSSCKVWYDGCNTCSRSSVGGPMACTLMACIQGGSTINPPTCREYFNSSEAPVIKSFSGPVQLNVNEKGTWKVDATSFNNQPLTYNITWGDELYNPSSMTRVPEYINSVITQSTTFEHTYNRAGTFTVTIEVKSQNGQTTKTTSTVNVKANNIKCYDAGTSYDEGASKSCISNSNGTQACIADAAYMCRSGVWKVEGYNWYRPL